MGTENFREKLGVRLVLFSMLALGVFSIAALVGAALTNAETFQRTAQLLIASLLPLFGTWVGTVLAFYYSKENFEAASASTLDMVKLVAQKLSSARVSDNMMRRESIIAETIPAGKAIGDLTIAAVEKRFESIGANGRRISRLLILDGSGVCLAILHRAIFAEMLTIALRDDKIDVSTDTLAPLLAKPYPSTETVTYGEFIEKTIACVAEDRSVADAKAEMEKIPGCQDVIVTIAGDRRAPIVGWISNIDIIRASQA